MSPELIALLSQVPLVGIFIWFVLEWSKRTQLSMEKRDEQMRDFLDAQRKQDREVLEKLTAQIDKTTTMLESHDKKTDNAITRMEERTRPRGKQKVIEVEE